MLRKSKPKHTESTSIAPDGALNIIVEGTTVEGKVHSASDIRIDGVFTGTLQCKGKLVIGPKGSVDGQVHCAEALIEGSFKGKLHVQKTLTLHETARVEGTVHTGQLVVQAGAIFNVECAMGGKVLHTDSSNGNDLSKEKKIPNA